MTAFEDLPLGATIVIPTRMVEHGTGRPHIAAYIADEVLPQIPLEQVSGRVWVAAITDLGQPFGEMSFTEQDWTPAYAEAVESACYQHIADQPARSWVHIESGHPAVTVGTGDRLPASAFVVEGIRPEFAQGQPTFSVVLRQVLDDGTVQRTSLPERSIPRGTLVWLTTRYGSHEDPSLAPDTPVVPVLWTDQVRSLLVADMKARTEPLVGQWTTSWDRIPPRRTWWQATLLTGTGVVLGIGGIPWGVAWLSIIGVVLAVYGLFWFLQTEPDPYKRRGRVDNGRVVLSAVAAATAVSQARSGRTGDLLKAGGMVGLTALSVQADREHEREEKDRVR